MATTLRIVHEVVHRELTLQTQVTKRICLQCEKEGEFQQFEILPKNGMVVGCLHSNGVIHKWSQYSSSRSTAFQRKKRTRDPKKIKCPVCGDDGRVNFYHTNLRKYHEVRYLVVHEKIKGTWGKGKDKIKKRRRCYITDPEHRNIILKELGRYIEK